jgi:hypothetical protein
MLHLDIPTSAQFRRLSEARADACVSIYLPTTPLSQEADAARIELGNLLKVAVTQLEDAAFDKRRLATLREHIEDLIDDDEFWRVQANSLAILATPDQIRTFRLANALPTLVEVSGRFHLKPLLRAITFPHAAIVLALSENGARLLEVSAAGPPVELRVADLPRDAASAAGRASINDRSPSGRIHGSEGKKVRLTQYARKVDAALGPVLAGRSIPLILAAAEPLASIFHAVSSSAELVATTIAGNPDRTSDADLASAARLVLDQVYAHDLEAFRALYETRAAERRTTTDLSDAARAAAYGAVEALLVDIDEVVPGTFDEATGVITLAETASKDSYGVVDAIAARALATGATVLAVRKGDIPGAAHLAAILRYPF